ncbi:MAG: energy transducer TonB [Saprospiraceae bacterium]|nr:energy transducer TonB [Saprospiraceae bacterium]
MKKSKTSKDFLKLPLYPGGNDAFRKFIEKNLKYPKQALEKAIEGVVMLEYEVDDMGNVHNPKVVNGLGFGCDEEALRLVKLLKYKKVKNRGVRVKSTIKTKIAFNIKSQNIAFSYTLKKTEKTIEPEIKDPPKNSYNYTINY